MFTVTETIKGSAKQPHHHGLVDKNVFAAVMAEATETVDDFTSHANIWRLPDAVKTPSAVDACEKRPRLAVTPMQTVAHHRRAAADREPLCHRVRSKADGALGEHKLGFEP